MRWLLAAGLAAAVAARPRRRVLYLIWRAPWMTVSADTYVSRTLALAGLDTVASDDAARVLVIGTRSAGDRVTYPDHDRVLEFTRAPTARTWTDLAGNPATSPYEG